MKTFNEILELNNITSSIELSEELIKLADASVENFNSLDSDYEEYDEEEEEEKSDEEKKEKALKAFEDKQFETIDILKFYFKEISNLEPLTTEQENNLFDVYAMGGDEAEEARDTIISSYLRFVVHCAGKYRGRGADYLDLIQEGNVGLIKAFDKFDHTKGFKFSTYAYYWIRNEISEYVRRTNSHGSIPREAYQLKSRIRKAENILSNEYTRMPTAEEIAFFIGEPIEKVNAAYRYDIREVSVNKALGRDEDDGVNPLQVIASETIAAPYEQSEVKASNEAFDKALALLNDREREIVCLSWGVNGKAMSNKDISELPQFDITPQRVGQIIRGAVKKIAEYPELISAINGVEV